MKGKTMATPVDLTAACGLKDALREDSLNLKALRDEHPAGSEEYDRLHGKENGVGGALITAAILLASNPSGPHIVFQGTINYLNREIRAKERAVVSEEHVAFTNGVIEGYKFALEKVRTEYRLSS